MAGCKYHPAIVKVDIWKFVADNYMCPAGIHIKQNFGKECLKSTDARIPTHELLTASCMCRRQLSNTHIVRYTEMG